MYISCSAEKKILAIPDQGSAMVSGYWTPELGRIDGPIHLKWEKGKVSSLCPATVSLECHASSEELPWQSYPLCRDLLILMCI
ncbi:hypothetical protein Desdi_2028 [Desulfitobacterium dichloroeliminans LMG P-21439]|uniref:Uncharacterized protein n=1 Tax=Desulfitobacterium dichloroeliminans (strain LMG P-21439 / DCA1) TaxID=871963 RepID=L0F948_DESDL|nr:hypothetical protein Desdi_2028 [Desulfitobacterium dichloroeliminans LMG P-21439]